MVSSLDCYPLDTVKSIKRVQSDYKERFEQKSVAQELIQNSLNEHQKGDLVIGDNLILVSVENVKDVSEVLEKINKGVSDAKQYYSNKEARVRSLEAPRKSSKSHGRGFLLVLFLGWDIITLAGTNCLMIAAVRP